MLSNCLLRALKSASSDATANTVLAADLAFVICRAETNVTAFFALAIPMPSRSVLRSVLALSLFGGAHAHGALYIPTPRNAMDAALPEFEGGKSPIEACTCNNGNGGQTGPTEGCDMGLRAGFDGKGDGQSCLWWSQVGNRPHYA